MERKEFEVIYWEHYDVNWYLWYKDGKISGLNFWHGEFDLKNGCDGPDDMLFNVYYNLSQDVERYTLEQILRKVYDWKMLSFDNR